MFGLGQSVEVSSGLAWKVPSRSGVFQYGSQGTASYVGFSSVVFRIAQKIKNRRLEKLAAYKWKSGSRIKADAQKSGELMEQLAASEEGLTEQTLLDANREEDAPLHNEYEWDDSAAAEKYRLSQSGHFLRCILTVDIQPDESEEPCEPQRAFFVTTEVHRYEPIEEIISIQTKYKKLLDTAYSELLAFKRKYESLKELKPVFDSIEQLKEVV